MSNLTAWHCIFVIVLYCIGSYFEFFHAPHTEVSIIKIGQFLKRHQCNWDFPCVHLYSSNFSSPIIILVGEMGLCHGKIAFVWKYYCPRGQMKWKTRKKSIRPQKWLSSFLQWEMMIWAYHNLMNNYFPISLVSFVIVVYEPCQSSQYRINKSIKSQLTQQQFLAPGLDVDTYVHVTCIKCHRKDI